MPEGISGRVSLVFSWVCSPSHKYFVEQGLGPAECLTMKLRAVYLFSFSGSMELAKQCGISCSPALLLQAILSFAFIGDLEGEAECFVSGRKKCFVQPKRKIFFFFFFRFIGKTWSHAISILPKPILGREMGERKADVKCCLSAVTPGLCSPPQGCGSSLPCLAQCCTRSKRCAVSPVPTQPFPMSLLCRGRALRLWTTFVPATTT